MSIADRLHGFADRIDQAEQTVRKGAVAGENLAHAVTDSAHASRLGQDIGKQAVVGAAQNFWEQRTAILQDRENNASDLHPLRKFIAQETHVLKQLSKTGLVKTAMRMALTHLSTRHQ